MKRKARTAAWAALAAAAMAGGCDDGSSSSGAGAGGGNPINQLADDPQSLYGKSAGLARDVAEDASQSGAAATGLANELGGGGGSVEVAGLMWTAPAAWASETPGSDRKAQFSIPGGATVYWSHFGSGGQGGSTQANIDRWASQVPDGEPEITNLTVSGVPVTIVAIEGTYEDGPPMGTKVQRRRWALRGAIIEGPRGMVFIKMTGPREAVAGAAGAFDGMVRGMKK